MADIFYTGEDTDAKLAKIESGATRKSKRNSPLISLK